MRIIKTNTKAKCYICNNEDQLYYVEFQEFVCKKDKERIDKFFSKLKTKHTRCSVETYAKKLQ